MIRSEVERDRTDRGREHAALRRSPLFGGVDMLAAQFTGHRFPPHAHEEYVLGVVERGCEQFVWQGREWLAPPGQILAVGPEEPHTGSAAGGRPWRYRTLYPSVGWLAGAAGLQPGSVVRFRAPVISDPELARRLVAAHAALFDGRSDLGIEQELTSVLGELVRRHGEVATCGPPADQHAAIRRAQAWLEDHYAQDVTLDDLARAASMTKFHLVRLFTRETGRSPHRVAIDLRIRAAKRRLAEGQDIAAVAAEVGFCDQSHLTRRFKERVGVTPGAYARAGGG